MSDQPVAPDSSSEQPTRPPDASAHTDVTIGPYHLRERVGEGGMGEVWLAEQTRPVRRHVALKIIKAGMDTAHVVARFEAERQALAVMDHPAIAKVFEAGATATGRPYFVMEYVRGEAITAYCQRHGLSTRDRLQLFLQVCDGVQHAHQKGIIHRDLKPSNILVTVLDSRPVPKIIDFGVAKAIAQPLTERPLYTELGMLIGTPEYMSPEQAEMTGLDIDTRTDVYALGVVLYELLTGVLPFDAQRLRESGLDDIRRMIREVEPVRPSARVTPAGSAAAAASRRPDPPGLVRELRGDLDWITMRALEKDRTRRYGSAAELASDVRRHLDHLPVNAGPPGARYRMSKFVRRHRVGVGVTSLLIATLLGFAATTAAQARRIARERDRANQEAAVAKAVADFLQNDLLAQASAYNQSRPNTKPDPNLTVRTALDRAAARIEGKFATQPVVEASIRHTIGAAYIDLGLYADAERQLERDLALRRRELGEEHPDTLASLASLAAVYERRGKLKEAEPLYLKALEMERRVLGPEHPNTLKTMNGLAVTYANEGQYDKAEAIYSSLIPIEERVLGEGDFETLRGMGNLAALCFVQRKYARAESLFLKTLELKRRALGDDNPESLDTMTNLAELYRVRADYARAEPLYVGAIAAYRRVLGDSHAHTVNAMNGLAELYGNRGDHEQAEKLYTQALDAARHNGEEHFRTVESMAGLARIYERQMRSAQAERLFTKVLEIRRRTLGDAHPDTLNTLVSLGRVRLQRQQYAEAESAFRDALSGYEKTAPDDWERYNCQSLLGASLAGERKHSEAEPLLIAGYEGMIQRQATIVEADRAVLDEAARRIVKLYQDWGMPDKAGTWTQKLQSITPGSAR